jgi:hypothetical protein
MAEHSPTDIAAQHPTPPAPLRTENVGAAPTSTRLAKPPGESPQSLASGSGALTLQPATPAGVETLLNGFAY